MKFSPLAVALVIATGACVSAQAAQTYTFMLLENYRDASGPWSTVTAMSAQGVVVGQSQKRPSADSPTVAVRWKNSTAKRLPGVKGESSSASGVNSVGQTVGYRSGGKGYGTALWESDGTVVDLPPLKGTETVLAASAVNDEGEVVGHGEDKKGNTWAIAWKNKKPKELPGLPGGAGARAVAIGNSGLVAGITIMEGAYRGTEATVWLSGEPIAIGDFGVRPSFAAAVNEDGMVVGWIQKDRGFRAFTWMAGVRTELGTLDGGDAFATGINKKGVAVGYGFSGASGGALRAILWEGRKAVDLTTYMDPASRAAGWVLDYAVAIDSRGAIAGQASNTLTGNAQPFVLTPN